MDKNIDWITVKGTHIPIKKGQSEEEAVKEFFDKKNKSYEKRTEEKNKQISKDYALMRSKDYVKSIEEHPNLQKEILFTNEDDTWLLVESWKKGEEGWDLVKAGKVIQHFNDRYEAYDAHDKGYFANVDAMNKEKTFDEKKADIRPITIKKNEIPQFESKKVLSNWMKAQFEELGSVKITDTGIDLRLSAGKANREAIKRRASKDENKAVAAKFKEIVSSAIKKEERIADERHDKDQEIYFNKFQIDGEDYEVEIFVDKPYGTDKNSYYAGHSASKIRIAPRDTMNVSNDLTHYAKGATSIIPYLEINFNPNVTINKASNKYQKVLDYIQNTKGEPMDKETKGVFESLINALKARNEAEKEAAKEEKKEETASNEDVDKRDIIRQIMAIAGKHEDNEDVRTIAKLAEKLAYDKSEAGTADNSKAKNEDEDDKEKEEAKNKCKNEEDDKDYKKLYEELKEKVGKEAENGKAKNSLDALKKVFFEGEDYKPEKIYMTQREGIELGRQLY